MKSKTLRFALSGTLAVLSVLGLFAFAGPSDTSPAIVTATSLNATDVDFTASRILRGSASAPAAEKPLLHVLAIGQLVANGPVLSPLDTLRTGDDPVQYLIVFRHPLAIGSIQITGTPSILKILKPGSSLPARSRQCNRLATDRYSCAPIWRI